MRKTAGVFLLSLLFACGQADRVPKGVLPKDKMRDVLLDMNYAEVFGRDQGIDTARIADSVREQNVKRYYVQILQLHGLSREEFQHSYKYYEYHPDKLEEIYKEMQEIVKRKREVLDSLEQIKTQKMSGIPGRTRRDSLYWPRADSMILTLP
ncbi:DUF4296 domain-containing protein [Chitinophaga sp. SYP-B3965]|uniref:DUF4296 domain-containing protein n=1 Tax=Chitinophaga sp. SYP-B3965 TaxID=2663120 RepID=UPI001299985A|nr:DUF4296 domain-containing protein [Chitinophaga sp. SYP-B3965]MRG48112.1 DUF4296 domain-containing protein [Chitinophaga sp. SYP-B3965]